MRCGGFIVLQVYKKLVRCALHPKVGGIVEMHDSPIEIHEE